MVSGYLWKYTLSTSCCSLFRCPGKACPVRRGGCQCRSGRDGRLRVDGDPGPSSLILLPFGITTAHRGRWHCLSRWHPCVVISLLRNISRWIAVKWQSLLLQYFCPHAWLLPPRRTGLNIVEAKLVSFTSHPWASRVTFSPGPILPLQSSWIKSTAPFIKMIPYQLHQDNEVLKNTGSKTSPFL